MKTTLDIVWTHAIVSRIELPYQNTCNISIVWLPVEDISDNQVYCVTGFPLVKRNIILITLSLFSFIDCKNDTTEIVLHSIPIDVIVGSGNCLIPDDIEPLPNLTLCKLYECKSRH